MNTTISEPKNDKIIDVFNDNKLLNKGISYDCMNYINNWNLLMEVVEKIESLENNRFSVEIHKGHCNIYDMVEMEEIVSIFNEDKKKSCYLGVIDFIKYYKKQKN